MGRHMQKSKGMWVPEIEHGLSGSMANAFIHQAILPAQKTYSYMQIRSVRTGYISDKSVVHAQKKNGIVKGRIVSVYM